MQTINELVKTDAIELDYTSADVPVIKIKSMAKMPEPAVLQQMHNELLVHQDDYRKGLVKKPAAQAKKVGVFKRVFNKIFG